MNDDYRKSLNNIVDAIELCGAYFGYILSADGSYDSTIDMMIDDCASCSSVGCGRIYSTSVVTVTGASDILTYCDEPPNPKS